MAEEKTTKLHARIKDISGQTFGKLSAISFAGFLGRDAAWLCKCECGEHAILSGTYLRRGGHNHRDCPMSIKGTTTTHGMTGTHEYRSWAHAKGRCFTPTDHAYKDYGRRGITMCNEWRDSFESFLNHIGKCPDPSLTLDRIDNTKGYEPGNVRWTSPMVQARNTRRSIIIEHEGVIMTLPEWAEKTGIPPGTLWIRYKKGSPPLFSPVQTHKPYAPRRKS